MVNGPPTINGIHLKEGRKGSAASADTTAKGMAFFGARVKGTNDEQMHTARQRQNRKRNGIEHR